MREDLREAIEAHLSAMRAEGLTASTIYGRNAYLNEFDAFASARNVRLLVDVAPAFVTAYQHQLGDRLSDAAHPLSLGALRHRLIALRQFLRWCVHNGRLAADPSAALRLPRAPRRIPRAVLSATEAERVLAMPDIRSLLGLRDRALLELLYSSGLRRAEAIGLDLADVDVAACRVFVREGKGRRDRVVPLGERAQGWMRRYLDQSRPKLLRGRLSAAFFVGSRGGRVTRARLTERLHGYLVKSGVGKPGSCHVWRHTMATLMHDGGADIRDLQQMLGHAELSTTAIYTRVSMARLAEVHRRTHPAEGSSGHSPYEKAVRVRKS